MPAFRIPFLLINAAPIEEQTTKTQARIHAERGRGTLYASLVLHMHMLTPVYLFRSADITSSIFYERIGRKDGRDIEFRFIVASPGEGPLRNASMGLAYRCPIGAGNHNRTNVLPPELQECGLFDFATSVKSNKRILFIGWYLDVNFVPSLCEKSDFYQSNLRHKGTLWLSSYRKHSMKA